MRKKSGRKTAPKRRHAKKPSKTRHSRLFEFPEAKGRTVEKVELSIDPAFPCISIRFQDNTDLTVVIDPFLTFQADYSQWKQGNQKVLKRWPVFRSDGT